MERAKITIIENESLHLPLTREFLAFCTRFFSERNPMFDDPYRDKSIVIPEVIQGFKVNYYNLTIEIKKGLKPYILNFLYKKGYAYEIKNETCKKKIDITFGFQNPEFKLKDYQETGKLAFLNRGSGIISFSCGMGKTVLALSIAGTLKLSTIILVHTTPLQLQWLNEIQELIHGNYTVGVLGGGSIQLGDITVALFQSFGNLMGSKEIFNQFGFVIIDECHHIPAETFYDVVTRFNATYYLGLSATLKRKDRKEFLTKFSIGECLYYRKRQDTGIKQVLNLRRFTYIPATTKVADKYTGMLKEKKLRLVRGFRGSRKKMPNWVDTIGGICFHKPRTEDIIYDVISAVKMGRKPLVLSDRVEHCKEMYTALQPFCKAKLAIGGDSDILKYLKNSPESYDVIVGTKVADEGMDVPSLDTLFLTCPLSIKDAKGEQNTSLLDQRIGRIGRVYPGKTRIDVYLYIDMFIDFFNETCTSIVAYLQEEGFDINNLN